MEIFKKVLNIMKDLFVGLLFLSLTVGFVLLIAGAMFYFKPQDFVGDATAFPRKLNQADIELGLRLAKLGGVLVLGSGALLWTAKKVENWLKHRKPKEIKDEKIEA